MGRSRRATHMESQLQTEHVKYRPHMIQLHRSLVVFERTHKSLGHTCQLGKLLLAQPKLDSSSTYILASHIMPPARSFRFSSKIAGKAHNR